MSRPLPGTEMPGDLVIGGYTADTDGSGPGLTVAGVRPDGLLEPLAEAGASGPSFVVRHPRLPLLYAVIERPDGGVAVFAEEPEGPRMLAEHPSGGSYPCHLAVDPEAAWLVIANYGDGTVAAYRLDEDGMPRPEPLLFPNEGHGPHPARQEGPHAHQAVFGPDGVLYVTDLGTDEMRRFLPDPATSCTTRATGTSRASWTARCASTTRRGGRSARCPRPRAVSATSPPTSRSPATAGTFTLAIAARTP
jgi:6-phosphogluconolactonase (cycloisomerase 2 family)